jgi:hypothetical protein
MIPGRFSALIDLLLPFRLTARKIFSPVPEEKGEEKRRKMRTSLSMPSGDRDSHMGECHG